MTLNKKDRERTRRILEDFLIESSWTGTMSRRDPTRAEFVKRVIEASERYARGYDLIEVRKPTGLEDICWHELNQIHPIGELANTYEEREELRVVVTGPRFPAFKEEGGKTIVVPELPKFEMWVIYVKDVNC